MVRKGAIDHEIAALATRQGGVVSRTQLRELGLSTAAIDQRVRRGRLHPVHRGVYAVGHRVVGARGRWLSSVLAFGPGAVLSHASAAEAWNLRQTASPTTHVSVPGDGGRKRRRGIRVHRAILPADEVTIHRAIPITTPARSILDLAGAGLRGRPLEAALDRAELLRILDFAELRRLLERHPARPGSPALATLLDRYVPGAIQTRSELEERFLALCDAHGIPRPRVNTVVAGRERDFAWPAARLVVEVDGHAHHRSPSELAADRERDVALVLAGHRVLRFTHAQVTERPAYVAAAVRAGVDKPMSRLR